MQISAATSNRAPILMLYGSEGRGNLRTRRCCQW